MITEMMFFLVLFVGIVSVLSDGCYVPFFLRRAAMSIRRVSLFMVMRLNQVYFRV